MTTDAPPIEITTESIYDERRVAVEFTGAPTLSANDGRKGRYQPDNAIISYGKPRGEKWRCIQANVFGPKLSAKGPLRMSQGTTVYYVSSDNPPTPTPDWVQNLIDRYLPTD